MKPSLLTKLETLTDRHEEVSAMLGDSEIITDQNQFRDLSREYSELESVVKCYADYTQVTSDLEEAQIMLEDSDPDLREMAKEGRLDPTQIEKTVAKITDQVDTRWIGVTSRYFYRKYNVNRSRGKRTIQIRDTLSKTGVDDSILHYRG